LNRVLDHVVARDALDLTLSANGAKYDGPGSDAGVLLATSRAAAPKARNMIARGKREA
jgi:hypothetical protein